MTINPYRVVEQFEEAIADFTGAPYVVSVESCTAALFLCLKYGPLPYDDTISIPRETYPSVPCSIRHAGCKVVFDDRPWEGSYRLTGTRIYDAALRFTYKMYSIYTTFERSPLVCLSFHIKKALPIGRGGAILTDDIKARDWFRRARFDGRRPIPLLDDDFDMLGWNCYLQPDQAARGLALLQALGDKASRVLKREDQGYPDLSKFKIYTQ